MQRLHCVGITVITKMTVRFKTQTQERTVSMATPITLKWIQVWLC